MLPWSGLALLSLYAGYVAYEASLEKRRAREAPPPGPDPVLELERMNTELARVATSARVALEAAREAVRRGV